MTAQGSVAIVRRRHELRIREVEVRSVTDLSASLRRIEVGEVEEDFPFVPMAVADHVKVILPGADGLLRLPRVEGGTVRPPAGGVRPIARDYTVAWVDGTRVHLDLVRHPHGPAGRWADAVRVGDRLGLAGPRGSVRYPDGCPHYVVGGDETALPALARWVAELRPGPDLRVFAEVGDARDRIAFPPRPGTVVTWLHRADGQSLAAVVREEFAPGTFVWLAGEALSLRPIRRALRADSGLPAEAIDVHGYWKRGQAGFDHHADIDD